MPTAFREKPREGEAHEEGDLLLRTGGQDVDRLLLPIPDQGQRQKRVVGPVQLGSGPQQLQPLSGNLKDQK
ncbi:hypothetical protein E4191_18280 (plasmid) [Paracoccus liaowanqingii]|uniref:Uncharacterized protein n=1 Tax=Paracoccus liaowanqingii TaxID=2560053 RepID=A0A4Y5STJ8_9RHOB|nr:hypothetical protein [Paracoccus liaowanqingii]QDA36076.1 hypothetical protein E4191_18280 [Paracoccus liaowanqingii]